MRKISSKVRKKKLRRNSANFAQKIQPFRGNPTCLKTGFDVVRSYRPHCQRKHFPQEFQTCQCCQVGTYLLLFYLYHLSYPIVSHFFFISYLRLFNLYQFSYPILSYFIFYLILSSLILSLSLILSYLLSFYLYHLSYPILSYFILITYLILSYLILSLSLILSYLLLFDLYHLFYPIYLFYLMLIIKSFGRKEKFYLYISGFQI